MSDKTNSEQPENSRDTNDLPVVSGGRTEHPDSFRQKSMQPSTDYLQNTDLIRLVLKWKKHLFVVVILAAVISAVVSLLITPKYKAHAILYPSNLIPYSDESPTEQMLQILQSDEIRDALVKKYNLYQHYNIDSTRNKFHRTALIETWNDNVSVRRTEFESVIIEVFDVDPDTSSFMVGSIVNEFNKKVRNLHREKSLEVVLITRNELKKKKLELDSMEMALQKIRSENEILDYEVQTEMVTDAYFRMISEGASATKIAEARKILDNLKAKGGEFVSLKELLWRTRGDYSDLKREHETALRHFEKELTYTNMVTSPVVPDKKAYPIRWLIVVLSTASTLFFGLLLIIAAENLRILGERYSNTGESA